MENNLENIREIIHDSTFDTEMQISSLKTSINSNYGSICSSIDSRAHSNNIIERMRFLKNKRNKIISDALDEVLCYEFHKFLNIKFITVDNRGAVYYAFSIESCCGINDFLDMFYTQSNIRGFTLSEIINI